jgi:hypothetical protein
VKRTIIITGIKDIDRKLRTLEPRIQKKVVRSSMRKGLKLIAAEVKSQVPVLSGLTKSAVKTRAVKKRRRGSIELEVLVDGKVPGLIKPSAKGPVFYPAIVEYKMDPFMRRSFTAKGEAARQVTLESLRNGIEQEVKS